MKSQLERTIHTDTRVKSECGTVLISAARYRNSNGAASIRIGYGDQLVRFADDDYEEHARVFLKLLEEVINDPCILPEIERSTK